MLRYLLLFAALCACINLLRSPVKAAPAAAPAKAKANPKAKPAGAPKHKGKKSAAPDEAAQPVVEIEPNSEAEAATLPDEGKLTPGAPGPLDPSRKFVVVEDPDRVAAKRTRVLPEIRTVPQDKPMAAYPDPPALSTLFGVQALPRDNEPSWIRTRRLHSMLLPPAPRPVVRTARKPVLITGKCVAVRGANQIVLQRGSKRTTVSLYAVSPVAGAGAKVAHQGLGTLVLGKVVTIYPANKPGQTGAWVFAGKTCANSEMVSRGWAKLLPGAPSKEAKLVSLQQAAKAGKRGVWAKS